MFDLTTTLVWSWSYHRRLKRLNKSPKILRVEPTLHDNTAHCSFKDSNINISQSFKFSLLSFHLCHSFSVNVCEYNHVCYRGENSFAFWKLWDTLLAVVSRLRWQQHGVVGCQRSDLWTRNPEIWPGNQSSDSGGWRYGEVTKNEVKFDTVTERKCWI